jgi:hypothetical protein
MNQPASVGIAEKFVAYRAEIHKLKAMLQLCPVPIAIAHTDGATLLYLNPAYTFFFGKTMETATEMWGEPWHPEDQPKLKAYWAEVVAHLNIKATEARYVFPPTGDIKVARITSTVLDGNGIIVYVFPEKCWDVPLQIIAPQTPTLP